MRKSIIVAASQNGVIGAAGKLPWHLPGDLKRFKQLTMGHTLIMGRKTYESIGRPLPGRTTVVLTRSGSKYWPIETEEDTARGARVYGTVSIEDAFLLAKEDSEVFICGGGEVYSQALPLVDRVYLTVVERDFEGDTEFDFIGLAHADLEVGKLAYGNRFRLVSRERGEGDLPHRFEIWGRVS